LFLVASSSYLRAIKEDALGAGRILGDRLFVVSNGATRGSGLRDFLVPADARLQHRVGGSRISLNARVAAFLLEQSGGDLEREKILSDLARVFQKLPALPVYQRTPLTDERAMRLIRTSIKANESISATAALQAIRRAGWACEQRRFGRLFHAVKGEVGAS
jgi:hypothetical protein